MRRRLPALIFGLWLLLPLLPGVPARFCAVVGVVALGDEVVAGCACAVTRPAASRAAPSTARG